MIARVELDELREQLRGEAIDAERGVQGSVQGSPDWRYWSGMLDGLSTAITLLDNVLDAE